jgi:hypothetical protein
VPGAGTRGIADAYAGEHAAKVAPGAHRGRARPRQGHAACHGGPRLAGQSDLPGGRPVVRVLPYARPDATDSRTGRRYTDVIMFWVPSESDKQALVQDQNSPFFTTPRFDGHPSVLVRASRISELTPQELTEIVHDAWLARASPARAAAWLSTRRGR